MPAAAQSGDLVTFPQSIRSWVMRGISDSNEEAPAITGSSDKPPKPGSAELNRPPFGG